MMTAHLGAQRGFSLTGTAERMALEADVAEAMVAAQAFHWFATRAALLENRRVVTPGGRLGLVWNVPDERVDWVAARPVRFSI